MGSFAQLQLLSGPLSLPIVTRLVKSTMLTGSAVCCAAETSARSLEALEDGVARFVILAAGLPACLADFL